MRTIRLPKKKPAPISSDHVARHRTPHEEVRTWKHRQQREEGTAMHKTRPAETESDTGWSQVMLPGPPPAMKDQEPTTPDPQESKERAETNRTPRRRAEKYYLSSVRSPKGPLTWENVPEVGLELHSGPCRYCELPETCGIRPDPTPVRPSPTPKVCKL
jgi:hypothetical protein